MKEVVKLENVEKMYKLGEVEVQALNKVNLLVREGEFVSILGPSGSGKTTMLNLIGALDKPTRGEVYINGVSLKNLNDKQLADLRLRTIGFIFQAFYLVPWLNALQNVMIPMMLLGKPASYRKQRAMELLKLVGLEKRAYHKPNELSGGEQQRVAIAVALANEPPLILADEPTGELDSYNTKIVTDYFSKINEELKKTIIIVTHDPDVTRIAHEVYRIEDGLIRGRFIPSQVYSSSYVNYSDIIKKRIEEIDEQLRRLDEEFKQEKIDGDKYVEERIRLKQKKQSLLDEIQ
jgi:ABC-type antimicrobial peptide transport system, ATPase component